MRKHFSLGRQRRTGYRTGRDHLSDKWLRSFANWIEATFHVGGIAPLMLGFTHHWEFWFCAIPPLLIAIFGIARSELTWIFIAIGWFFGFYVFFVIVDIVRSKFKNDKE